MIAEIIAKKPAKIYWSALTPATDNKVVIADGPGIGMISISSLWRALINNAPGSEMIGVPASETNTIFFPFFSSAITCWTLLFSLNFCKLNNGFFIPIFWHNKAVTRVSSAAIKSTSFSVWMTLSEISFKLPIGVAETKRRPTLCLIESHLHMNFLRK